jgi:hypothetical protein
MMLRIPEDLKRTDENIFKLQYMNLQVHHHYYNSKSKQNKSLSVFVGASKQKNAEFQLRGGYNNVAQRYGIH